MSVLWLDLADGSSRSSNGLKEHRRKCRAGRFEVLQSTHSARVEDAHLPGCVSRSDTRKTAIERPQRKPSIPERSTQALHSINKYPIFYGEEPFEGGKLDSDPTGLCLEGPEVSSGSLPGRDLL